jgi:flagellar biosynthesis protein FlhG
MAAKIWVVGSGKGGVGKSFIASSLAITLSKLNHKVLLVDYDYSGANLHTTFRIPPTEKNIYQFFTGSASLEKIAIATDVPKLSLIQGSWDTWQPSEYSLEQTSRVIEATKKSAFDYVVFDVGAGPAWSHMELFYQADEKIIVSNSEPTAVEKNYRFIESFIFYSLKTLSAGKNSEQLQAALKNYRATRKGNSGSFKDHITALNLDLNMNYFDWIHEKPIRLIINQSRSRLDQDLGHSIKSVCHKYFDLPLSYLGSIDFDNAVWQSVKSREAFLIGKPFTPLSAQFLAIIRQMATSNTSSSPQRAVV